MTILEHAEHVEPDAYTPRSYRPLVTAEDRWRRFAEIIAEGLVEAWENGSYDDEISGNGTTSNRLPS